LILVLDSSATLTWVLDEETRAADKALDLLAVEQAFVPAHWILEVTNVLRIAVRRQRLKTDEFATILARLRILPITVDAETAERGWKDTFALANEYDLTTYDAAYMELAMRLNAPLATLDQELARAARKAGVALV
jgi:predicted nucleic acid-binding protein